MFIIQSENPPHQGVPNRNLESFHFTRGQHIGINDCGFIQHVCSHVANTDSRVLLALEYRNPPKENIQFFFLKKSTNDPRIDFSITVRCEGTGSIIGLIWHMANAVLLRRKMQNMDREPGTNQGTI